MKFRLSLAALVCVGAFVAFTISASAFQLSMPTARHDIHRVINEVEHPTSMRLSGCRRLSPIRVRCHVQVTQIAQPTPSQIGTITELTGIATATLRAHRHPAFRYIDVRY